MRKFFLICMSVLLLVTVNVGFAQESDSEGAGEAPNAAERMETRKAHRQEMHQKRQAQRKKMREHRKTRLAAKAKKMRARADKMEQRAQKMEQGGGTLDSGEGATE